MNKNAIQGEGDIIAVACESSKVQIHSLIEKAMIKEFEAHTTRVRCITSLSETVSIFFRKLKLLVEKFSHC